MRTELYTACAKAARSAVSDYDPAYDMSVAHIDNVDIVFFLRCGAWDKEHSAARMPSG
jgi:hypothetical protein